MIIQCPSCTTKFAIDSSTVDELDAPRFHCSRCDHLFSFEDAPPSVRPMNLAPSATRAASNEFSSSARLTNSEEASDPPPAQRESKQLALPTRGLQIPAPLSSPQLIRAPHEGLPLETPQRAQLQRDQLQTEQWQQGESDLTHVQGPTAPTPEIAPHFELTEQPRRPGDYVPSLGPPPQTTPGSLSTPLPISPTLTPGSTGHRARFETQSALSASNPAPIPAGSGQYSAPLESNGTPVDAVRLYSPDFPHRDSPHQAPGEAIQALKVSPAVGPTALGRRLRRALPLLAPTIVFIITLGALAALPWIAPSTSISLTESLFPAAPQVAPPGLLIRNLKYRVVTLESGERAAVVTGELVNDSAVKLQDITIEALLFDSSGRQLAGTRASAGSPLARGRLRSLSPELLYQAQHSRPARDFALDQGRRQDFALVLFNSQGELLSQSVLDSASQFSARVFTVQVQ